jgi:hypothetical protein
VLNRDLDLGDQGDRDAEGDESSLRPSAARASISASNNGWRESILARAARESISIALAAVSSLIAIGN